MATLWKFYPPHPALASATLTAVASAGTSSTLANAVNNRRLSLMDVDTVGTYVSGADELLFRVDFGSGVTKVIDFVGFVNHNLFQEAADIRVYYDTADNAALTSAATVVSTQTAGAADEPIWIEPYTTVVAAKRYYWIFLDAITSAAYIGELLLGQKVEPTNDPNWESDIEIDIESGRIVNKGPGGYNWKTRTHGVKRGWQVHYEFLNDADRAILENWLTDADYADTPFVFTTDGGTTFYYGELLGNPVITPVQQGLTNISFTISEVIA